ncbi:DUF6361 family protein [Amycolatopsis sp. NPDC051128]|uniref:DUF6361 family protein n=1 Tax=Amycolatopsis sp. NPDC051128 TaxID=3155412 RepID=UPI0034216330
MGSVLAWLDGDDEQRRRMLQVVQLFKDESTVDELGIGSIRDAIADTLFPGTSVLHTRLRYLLFVPWLVDSVARSGMRPDQAADELRRREIRLIRALLRGNQTDGVIGKQAGDKLKRMPSAAYWAATLRFGIRTWDTSIDGFFRKARGQAALRSFEPESDDPGIARAHGDTGFTMHLPPPPGDLFEATTFDLEPAEAGILADYMAASTRGSLIAWLTQHGRSTSAESIWRHEQLGEFPLALREAVDHGRRFRWAIYGAVLLYNLMLAERVGGASGERYSQRLAGWQDDLRRERPLDGWSRPELWRLVSARNPRLSPLTQRFVESWLSLVESGEPVDGSRARTLVTEREVQIKGGRARLRNDAALDRWRGESGLSPLDYRWTVTRGLLNDLHLARTEAAHARP